MFTVDVPTTIASIGELRSNAKRTLEAAQETPVVVLVDGRPVGVIISMEEFAVFQESKESARLARVAGRRLERVRDGEDHLMEHDDFWSAARARKAGGRAASA